MAHERWLDQWTEEWAERIQRYGLDPVVFPLLEIGRGLGVLASHALLLAQPLLAGLVNDTQIERYVTLLEDPATLERLMDRIEQKAEDGG